MLLEEPLRTRQLQALYLLEENGTISLTAKAMGVSQPAVSRLLADLSKELGFKLYFRTGKRLSLTREARFLLPEISRIFASMGQIRNLHEKIQTGKSGHLRIACLPGFSTSHLPGVVAEFLAARPDVTITIEPDRPERILDWIIGEQYDCAITDNLRSHHAVVSKSLSVRCVCIFPTGHRFENKRVIRPKDLARERIAHDLIGSEFHTRVRDAFDADNVEITSFIETRQFTCACELAANGACVSIVSELDAHSYKGKGVSFRPFRPELTHDLTMVWPRHKSTSILTLEFLDQFERSIKQFAP